MGKGQLTAKEDREERVDAALYEYVTSLLAAGAITCHQCGRTLNATTGRAVRQCGVWSALCASLECVTV